MVHLPPADFKKKVELATLIAFDFIVSNENNQILLGKRKNAPAKGSFFIPGGSMQKDETFAQAIERISKKELGTSLSVEKLTLHGIYEHFYTDNFQDKNTTTHYISIAYDAKMKSSEIKKIFQEQHEEIIWLSVEDLLKHPQVHEYTKEYFRKNPKNRLKTE